MFNALQKLRTVAVMAHAKIIKNARKKVAGKWEDNAFNADGVRDWRLGSLGALLDKLLEESQELQDALQNSEPPENVLMEAGDVSAVSMFLADRAGCFAGSRMQPKIVCLCGSTKFRDEFMKANFEETMKGNIVLSVGFFMHSDQGYILREDEKELLDDLHKRKIDISDEILVINVGGYVGDSTRSEIQHAQSTGKEVRWRYSSLPVEEKAVIAK